MCQLVQLREVNLAFNRLTSLPAGMASLVHLTELDVRSVSECVRVRGWDGVKGCFVCLRVSGEREGVFVCVVSMGVCGRLHMHVCMCKFVCAHVYVIMYVRCQCVYSRLYVFVHLLMWVNLIHI